MTLNQFTEKIDELLDTARAAMRIRAENLFRSGAVDPEAYEDNFVLPKIILVACLEKEADNWRPLAENKATHKAIANLRHF